MSLHFHPCTRTVEPLSRIRCAGSITLAISNPVTIPIATITIVKMPSIPAIVSWSGNEIRESNSSGNA